MRHLESLQPHLLAPTEEAVAQRTHPVHGQAYLTVVYIGIQEITIGEGELHHGKKNSRLIEYRLSKQI